MRNATMSEIVQWFQETRPDLVYDMKQANHHNEETVIPSINPYHIESDIFTHNMLVCKQAEKAPYRLKLAALLHDIGKPSTRSVNPKNGNVSFYNHDAVGAFMALEILKRPELELTKEEQVRIFSLIALHTQIYKLSVEQLAAIGDKELVADLIELGKYDHEGRFHSKGDAVIPTIEHIEGISSLKRGTYWQLKEKEVVILVGLPASGKSTWAWENYINTNNNFSIISRDSFIEEVSGLTYSEKWQKADQNKINNLLEDRLRDVVKYPTVSTIVDMTHMSKKSRRKSLSHFGPEYKKKAVVFLTDLQTLSERNSNREGKAIPQEVIEKMMRSFYLPTMEEIDEIEFII